jgi:hypothetical protein
VKELVAYFDDSRNEDAGIVVVAGYVASVATWDRFGSAWARALGPVSVWRSNTRRAIVGKRFKRSKIGPEMSATH